MELKKPFDLRKVFVGLYAAFFAIYLIIGLQPAEAASYEISANLNIPSLSLTADVTTLQLEDDRLNTPDTIVGSFTISPRKTLLIGHSSTVFSSLDQIQPKASIIYDDTIYQVIDKQTLLKADVDMSKLLKSAPRDTIVIMTCAGTNLDNGDATHRLIVIAIAK